MIAIIGSTGYIGSMLHSYLSTNYVVHGFHSKNIQELRVEDYDVVIYLAGLTRRCHCLGMDQESVNKINVEKIVELANDMRQDQLLVYASSASIGEGYVEMPMKECDPVFSDLFDNYTVSMYKREESLRETKPKCIGLRLGTVIGNAPKPLIDFCYYRMIRDAVLERRISVTKTSKMRSILTIDDLTKAVQRLIDCKDLITHNDVYNMESYHLTIKDIANSVANLLNVPIVEIEELDEQVGFCMDTTKFMTQFDFSFKGIHEDLLNSLIENMDSFVHGCCRVCKKTQLLKVFDLGYQPLANEFLVSKDAPQERFPLTLVCCKDCFHTQLNYTVPPQKLFSNYLYTSGVSNTMKNYFDWMASKAIKESNKTVGKVLEIACNDGSQLNAFSRYGWETYGVDPAANLIEKIQGHNLQCGFWGQDRDLEKNLPNDIDVVIAANVIAHVPDPVVLIQGCSRVMNENTLLYVQTSQYKMFENGEFDTMYHEHYSFFTVHSMKRLASICGLQIVNIELTDVHGTSLLCTLKKSGVEKGVQSYLEEEARQFVELDAFFERYRNCVYKKCSWIRQTITKYKEDGYQIIGYGAPAKGMVLLNFLGDVANKIEFIVDESPYKVNKYAPGCKVPIYSQEALQTMVHKEKVLVVVLAWNYREEILKKIKLVCGGLKDLKAMVAYPENEIITC